MSADKKNSEFVKVLKATLDRPIAFHRAFVKLTGSVTAALMLSQAMYWSQRTSLEVDPNGEGWFYKVGDEWREETGLSRFEQEGARKTLRKFSFWKEELRDVPAKMHYRVDTTALSDELLRQSAAEEKAKEEKAKEEKAKEKANKNARLLKTSKQVCGKPASKHEENQQTRLLETSQHYKDLTETTTETTTTTPQKNGFAADQAVSDPGSDGGRRDLIKQNLETTILAAADVGSIIRAADKYNRTDDDIVMTIDVLDQQYRKSKRSVEDSTALVIAALKDAIAPPDGYVSKSQREAEAKQKRESAREKADEKSRAKEAEDNAYKEAEARLTALPDEKREELFSKAKQTLPTFMQNSQMAIKAEAIKMMIEGSQFTGERKAK